jgi:thiol-disulfide isomerase/thioredoxin
MKKLLSTLGLIVLLSAGCEDAARQPNFAKPGESARVTRRVFKGRDEKVTLTPIDEKLLADMIAQSHGKVVLVDFWATWCGPCVALFPHSVELDEKFAGRGLQVMSISLDDPKQPEPVLEFLKGAGAEFPNFISRYGVGSQVVEAFGIRGGALPFLKLYDRQGNLRKVFGGDEPVNPDAVDRAVQALLDEASVAAKAGT